MRASDMPNPAAPLSAEADEPPKMLQRPFPVLVSFSLLTFQRHTLTDAIAKEEMTRLANTLYISNMVDAAFRLFEMVRCHQFHRPLLESVAICLYVVCRQKPGNTTLLIDFAEKIKVSERSPLNLTLLMALAEKRL
jgi:hypothetical protein